MQPQDQKLSLVLFQYQFALIVLFCMSSKAMDTKLADALLQTFIQIIALLATNSAKVESALEFPIGTKLIGFTLHFFLFNLLVRPHLKEITLHQTESLGNPFSYF